MKRPEKAGLPENSAALPLLPPWTVKDPLLAPLIAIVTGILVSRWAGFETRFEIAEVWVAFGLLAGLSIVSFRRSRALGWAASLTALVFAGVLLDVLHRPGAPPSIDASSQETVLLDGCVVDPPIFYEGRDQFTIELAPRANARVSLMIREGETPPALAYGQPVELEARVRPVRNFQNPGSFDFVLYSARREIYWTASVRAGAPVKVLPGRCGSRFFAFIFALRSAALERLERLYPKDSYAVGMMQAILIGETTKLEKIWTDHFRRTGTFHALVISGQHVAVLAGTLLFLLRVCFIGDIPALFLTAIAAWIYALVSGWSAPVVRAAGGFTLYLLCRYFYRKGRILNLLAAVGIVYLAYDPGQLFESSFLLSFLSVAAIGTLAVPLLEATSGPFARNLGDLADQARDLHVPPRAANLRVELRLLAETLHWYVRLPQVWVLRGLGFFTRLGFYVFDMAVISTVIQVGLALPMAIYFHRVSFTGISANLIVVPLFSLVVPVGFLAIFTGWHLPAAAAELCLALAEKAANWHARFEPEWRVPNPPVWLAVAFAASLLLLAFALRMSRWWRYGSVAAVLGLFTAVCLHPFPPRVSPGQLELAAIDVGQGDSLLVAFPDGKLMLVDGGGFPNLSGMKIKPKLDIGEDVVSPYLWSRSIKKLDVIVCTHAHEDHTGGLGALIANFHPAEVWTGANTDNPVWLRVRDQALSHHVKIQPLRAGRTFDFGGTHIEILSPSPDYVAVEQPKNNDSLAFRISYGKHVFLLTGDMEKQAEGELLANGALAHADVLKVGHHGSKTSSSEPFLDAVRPTFAVISDGFENSFHHPHPEVLARLREHHAEILRTDRQGLIAIRSDGRRFTVSTALPAGNGTVDTSNNSGQLTISNAK